MHRFSPVTWGLAVLLHFSASAALQEQTTPDVTTVSVVNSGPIVAPGSLAASWGANFITTTTAASALPLTTTLGGLRVSLTDVDDAQSNTLLYLASPTQINFVTPETAALGKGSVSITGGATPRTGDVLISNVAPTLITTNSMGTGTAAAQTLSIGAGNPRIGQTVDAVDLGGSGTSVYLMLYGSGIRKHSENPVIALVDGVKVPVLYEAAQSEYPGLDQVNIGPLPRSLAGKGTVDLQLCVDGVPANVVTVTIR